MLQLSFLFINYNQSKDNFKRMSEKPKFIFTPSSPQYTNNTLRTSFQAMSYKNLHHQIPSNSYTGNGSINTEQKAPGMYQNNLTKQKNYSANIKQLEGKIQKFQNIYSHIKKQESNTPTNKYTSQVNDLRNSLSTNQFKRPDIDFLRKTAVNTPKGFNFYAEKYLNQLSDSTDVNSQETQIKSPQNNIFSPNNVFIKKSIQPSEKFQQGPEALIKGKFSGKNSFMKQANNNGHRQQRKSLTKKSMIIGGFYLGKCLGSGKFGQVYLAKHIASGFVCALKKIVKAKVKEYNMINQLIQEIKIQCFLHHPNIVQFYGVISDELNIYIIMQYMEGGTLFDYANDRELLPQLEAVVFLRQICRAVKYMHDKNIIHRDIKPQNIVMSYNLVKLCDFGWATRISGTRKTVCGTSFYFSPELVQQKEYDQSLDIWCIGILTYELLTGKVPFEHKQRKIMMQKIANVDKQKIQYPQNMSELAKQFIECLTKKNPNERLKTYKILEHPFLKIEDEKQKY